MGKRSKDANGEKAASGKKKKKTAAAAAPAGEMTLSPATPTATTPRAPAAGRSPTGLTEGAFKAMAVHAHFSLLPHCLDDVRGHVFSLLQDALMRYAPDLEGVPVAVDNVALVPGCKHGRVYGIDPHVHVDVRLNATVFCPRSPQVLPGRVNAVAASYVGLLVHGSFNASIVRAPGVPPFFPPRPAPDSRPKPSSRASSSTRPTTGGRTRAARPPSRSGRSSSSRSTRSTTRTASSPSRAPSSASSTEAGGAGRPAFLFF